MENIQECVYSNHTASYESLLNKARLPSLEVGRQMNIAIQTLKILSDLAPTYLLEMSHTQYKGTCPGLNS